jgi:hypothetical protein
VSPTTEAVAVGPTDSDGSVDPALGLCGEEAVVSRSVNTLAGCALISHALAIAASAAEGTNSGELSFVRSQAVLPVAPFFLGVWLHATHDCLYLSAAPELSNELKPAESKISG